MFSEIRFPEDISFGAIGGPQFSTNTILMQSGREQRNRNWKQARMRYKVSFGLRSKTQMETLVGFFYARGGKAEGFRFKDWAAFTVKGQLLGIGDGSTCEFQFVKDYPNYRRIIRKPVPGSVLVNRDDQLLTSGYRCDYASGTLIFDVPVATGKKISADFEFDIPVRFNVDYLPVSHDGKGIFSVTDIELLEVCGA